jgi:hypothetical protein
MAQVTKLRDVHIVRAQVPLSNNKDIMEVRGVNASDLILLTTLFGPAIAMAWAKFKTETDDGQKLTQETMFKLVSAVSRDAPLFLGWIIAVAADDPCEEAAAMASQFPLVDQASLVNEIINQTFTNEATVKKLTQSLGTAFLTIFGAVKVEAEGLGLISPKKA